MDRWINDSSCPIETLLCIEADRMDVHKRYTDTNVELKAQGIGNILSSLIGGFTYDIRSGEVFGK
jgi:MFS superfamily sulfate permease-like transporter